MTLEQGIKQATEQATAPNPHAAHDIWMCCAKCGKPYRRQVINGMHSIYDIVPDCECKADAEYCNRPIEYRADKDSFAGY